MLATPYKRRTGVSFSALRGKRPDHPALALPSPVARALAHLAGTTAPPPGGHSPRRSLRNPHAPAFSGAISATSFHHRRPESSSMHLCHPCVQLQQQILAYILERGASFLKLEVSRFWPSCSRRAAASAAEVAARLESIPFKVWASAVTRSPSMES